MNLDVSYNFVSQMLPIQMEQISKLNYTIFVSKEDFIYETQKTDSNRMDSGSYVHRAGFDRLSTGHVTTGIKQIFAPHSVGTVYII